MNRPSHITAAVLCGILASAPIVQVADRVSELLKGGRGESPAACPDPSPTPAAGASLLDPAPADDLDSRNFTTDANGFLVNTRDTVTRTKGSGGITVVSITITPVRSGGLPARN